MLGELIDQEGIIVYQGARYKPLPAIAQVNSSRFTCLLLLSIDIEAVKTRAPQLT